MTGTRDFQALERLDDSSGVDVLRISSPGTGFEVVIRVLTGQYSDGSVWRTLGPLLVIGNAFPSEHSAVPAGYMISLRPKVARLAEGAPNAATVERIVQWCFSRRFKATRVNSSGGRWVGYHETAVQPVAAADGFAAR